MGEAVERALREEAALREVEEAAVNNSIPVSTVRTNNHTHTRARAQPQSAWSTLCAGCRLAHALRRNALGVHACASQCSRPIGRQRARAVESDGSAPACLL